MSESPIVIPEAIPMLDLKPEVAELWEELQAAIERVLRGGQFVLGDEVAAFEEEVSAFLGVKHAIGVNSGTDALTISLRALGVGAGDEVITTPFTFFATVEAILHVGATPVFVDVCEDSFNIDPNLLEAAVTERTRAIVPVHLFGDPAAMTAITAVAHRHQLAILEDAAQSFGAVYYGDARGDAPTPDAALVGKMTGTIGAIGAFSFYPTKNLGAYGDAGLVATNDDDLADRVRALRHHGQRAGSRDVHAEVGYNSRLDALQAAILRVKLPHVPAWNAIRRHLAERYASLLQGLPALALPAADRGHVFHQYTVKVDAGLRDRLQEGLHARGVSAVAFYRQPLPVVGAAAPVSRRLATQVLSLPLWPSMSEGTVRQVADSVQDILVRALD
ncbi:MAG: DegT/DnrJ/EryC1/StrS family aminotransferase [Deinococcales bacterium]